MSNTQCGHQPLRFDQHSVATHNSQQASCTAVCDHAQWPGRSRGGVWQLSSLAAIFASMRRDIPNAVLIVKQGPLLE